MSTLILPTSIRGTEIEDNARADATHADADEEARALASGIERTERWARTEAASYAPGDKIIAVRTPPGKERVVHIKPDGTNQSGMKVRVYPIRPPRPCPGCGKNIYGIGEVQTAIAPWHLACWEMERTMQEMAGSVEVRFDDEGLPIVTSSTGRGRPRRRRR